MIKKWKYIDSNNFKTTKDLLDFLKNKDYKVSYWIEDIYTNIKNKILILNKGFDLHRFKVSDLGFNQPTELIKIYEKFQKLNFKPVPPFIALLSRTIYDEQPVGEWLRIAVPFESMIDSDGVPHLPKLGSALNKLFIETYWAYPHAIFHPHNDFIVTK